MAIARDDRSWAGSDPPAVAYLYAPGGGKEHAVRHLAGFTGVLKVNGYAACDAVTLGDGVGSTVTLAQSWWRFRRRFYDVAKCGNPLIANDALQRIGVLYVIEAEIRERSSDERRSARQDSAGPIVESLEPWLKNQLRRVSGRSAIAEAMRYGFLR